MSEEKPKKPNGLGTDPMQRLTSMKAPRDFSLGGAKPNKKVFTPNLNVSRNKNKSAIPNLRDNKKDDKNRRDRQRDKKNFNKNGPNIIKSSGVFSEGMGSAERHSSRISYGRESDPAPVMQKPTIRVKDVIKIDKELEEQKIKSVFGGSGLDDEEPLDFKQVTEKDAPIKLPMDDRGWSKKQVKPTVKVKQEVVVKQEPGDEDCATLVESFDEKPVPDLKQDFGEDTDVLKLLKNTEPTLILLQFPDSLPGRGGSVEDDAPRRKKDNQDEPSTSTGEGKEEKPVDNRCKLADLEEGRIGKLQLHRSGRVSLCIGSTVFEVSMGTKAAFHQEVVSMAADETTRSANLIALGPLQHKLNLMPEWDTLFQDLSV